MKYTVGRESMDDPYHIDIIKEKLRELGYSETDYPKTAAWNKILNRRAELTDRSKCGCASSTQLLLTS